MALSSASTLLGATTLFTRVSMVYSTSPFAYKSWPMTTSHSQALYMLYPSPPHPGKDSSILSTKAPHLFTREGRPISPSLPHTAGALLIVLVYSPGMVAIPSKPALGRRAAAAFSPAQIVITAQATTLSFKPATARSTTLSMPQEMPMGLATIIVIPWFSLSLPIPMAVLILASPRLLASHFLSQLK